MRKIRLLFRGNMWPRHHGAWGGLSALGVASERTAADKIP